jgi:hypothetical protein
MSESLIEAILPPPEVAAFFSGAKTLDQLEVAMADPRLTPAECPVTHRFVPGMYIREIFIPAGTVIISATHKQTHPFIISMGLVRVVSEQEGAVEYAAPHTGITQAGTRRLLYTLSPVIWTTFHPTDKCTVEEVLPEIFESHVNPDLPDDFVPDYYYTSDELP